MKRRSTFLEPPPPNKLTKVTNKMLPDNIFTSCRKGDLYRIQYLVEKKEIDLNVRDVWDSSPLYYACLCGHEEVVKYLLDSGARCQANTFDGERCLYGALTNEIKRILLDSKIVNSSSKRRDDFDEFCEKMMRAEEFSDITLIVGEQTFKLHRCVLAARSDYFSETLETKWKTKEINTNAIDSKAFDEFMKFVYTGRLTCSRDQCDEICKLSDKCRVRNLTESLKDACHESEYFEHLKKRVVKISTLIVDTPSSRNDLQADFASLLNPGVPEEFVNDPLYGLKYFGENIEADGVEDPLYDLYFLVEGHRFYCNKIFLCTRSEYFSALVRDHFAESGEENGNPVIRLHDIKAPVFTCLLYYIYTNAPSQLNDNIVLDLLQAADIYLLPGLKRHCGSYLCGLISEENVFDLLRIARMHDLTKLEDTCADFMAVNISTVIRNEDFRSLVIADANEVTAREETDTIPIIDDIRYHITSQVGTFSELEDAQTKLKLIDDLLEDLCLEA